MPNLPPQESQPYPWATAIIPPHPRGWYSPIYRAMDTFNGFRVYPAFYGQFFGPYTKRDYWWAGEFAEQLPHICNGHPWGDTGVASVWDHYANLYHNLHDQGFYDGVHYWARLWVVLPTGTLPYLWETWEATIQGPNRVKNLATQVSYPFGTCPILNNLVPEGGVYISDHVYPPVSFPGDPDIG